MKLRKKKDAPEGRIVASVNGNDYAFEGTKAVEVEDAFDAQDLLLVGFFESAEKNDGGNA